MDFSQLPLRPMQQPEMIGWWPLAPGWWLLILLSIALFIAVVWFGYLYLKKMRNNPNRWALQELNAIQANYQQHQNKRLLAEECNALLKRLALTLYSRQEVAALNGTAWTDFLAKQSRSDTLTVLAVAPYQASPEYDAEALLSACKAWLVNAKGNARGPAYV
ncbi:DUF4381 domain-containing protein [Neptuniibacter sp. PT8_73]|uniref:DUF4381 domain-containing protein n=1 Tax=unclassified Neptuniibacter TaxID=2630693 RepID=UPI0039F6D258